MSREWKPGDVVLDPDQTGAARVALVVSPHFSGCPSAHREYGVHVHYGDGDWNALKDRFLPLVVIDPEDREAVERLADYLDSAYSLEYAQQRLREYANPKPPRPDEPQGLGAVVEDEDGVLWFRMAVENQTWPGEVWQEQYGDADRWSKWDSFAAVRVLSPGVEADQ